MFKTICSTLHYEYLYIIVNCERIRIFILKVKTVYQQIVFFLKRNSHMTLSIQLICLQFTWCPIWTYRKGRMVALLFLGEYFTNISITSSFNFIIFSIHYQVFFPRNFLENDFWTPFLSIYTCISYLTLGISWSCGHSAWSPSPSQPQRSAPQPVLAAAIVIESVLT